MTLKTLNLISKKMHIIIEQGKCVITEVQCAVLIGHRKESLYPDRKVKKNPRLVRKPHFAI